MNDIVANENSKRQMENLAAQRLLYTRSKRIFVLVVNLSGPLAVVLAFVALRAPAAKPYILAWSGALSLADIAWFSRRQKTLRETAAKIQEAFDCEVLGLPWNQLKVGQPIEHEVVLALARAYCRVAMKYGPLHTWYPAEVATLPLPGARAVCQRINCWWDVQQRTQYLNITRAVTGGVVCVIVFVAFWKNMTFAEFASGLFAPFLPLISLGVRQAFEHSDAIARLEKLKEHAGAMWKKLVDGVQPAILANDARSLQDEIYDSRRRNPPVLDWLYERLRATREQDMIDATKEYVRQLQAPERAVADGGY